MTPPARAPLLPLRLLLSACALTLMAAVDSDTCFSRQHQDAIVNVRSALNRPGTAMDTRVVQSERDCVLACCSEEVKPGELRPEILASDWLAS